MFPLIAIGGAIGAAMSIAKGASWVVDKLDAATSSSSVGGKGDVKPADAAKLSAFQDALSAQVAGQKQPVSTTPTAANLPLVHGTDYDSLARMKAGVVAYHRIGEHHAGGAKAHPSTDDGQVGRA